MTAGRAVVLAALLALPAWGADEDPIAGAQALVKQGRFSEALVAMNALLAGDKENVPARMTAAAACLGGSDPDGALEHLKWVKATAPATPGYQMLRGRALLLQADEAAGEQDEKAQRKLGGEAADAFAKALAEAPGRPSTLAFHAMALRAAGRTDDARKAYAAWIAAAPRDPNAYGAAAAFLAETGRWSETEGLIAGAPQDDPASLHAIRSAVLLNGFGVVPWETLRPLYDTVDAAETDPQAKKNLAAYRGIMSADGIPAVLAVLDYLDADPSDRLGMLDKIENGWPPAQWMFQKEPIDGIQKPELDHRVSPTYPEIARRARIEGRVEIFIRIRKDGTVGSMHLFRASNPMFTSPAFAAVEEWRFVPVRKNGEAIEFPYVVRVDFRLK